MSSALWLLVVIICRRKEIFESLPPWKSSLGCLHFNRFTFLIQFWYLFQGKFKYVLGLDHLKFGPYFRLTFIFDTCYPHFTLFYLFFDPFTFALDCVLARPCVLYSIYLLRVDISTIFRTHFKWHGYLKIYLVQFYINPVFSIISERKDNFRVGKNTKSKK